MGLSNLISRIGKIFEANSNAALDNMEDPTKMTKQAVLDLKQKLQKALEAEVQLKALVIGKRTKAQQKKDEADMWGHKAEQILDRVESKQITEADGDRLATEALAQQQAAQKLAIQYAQESVDQQKILDGMDAQVKKLHDMMDGAENQAEELSARQQSADAEKAIGKELSSMGTNNTKELLDRMRKKTEESEHIAQAYVELDKANKSTKDEIDDVLGASNPSANNALAALKAARANKAIGDGK